MADLSLVASTHSCNVNSAIINNQNNYDRTVSHLAQLSQMGCQFSEISEASAFVVSFDEWSDWCEGHADIMMADAPDTNEARAFKGRLVTKLKGAKITAAEMIEQQLIDLDFTDESSHFIFGYMGVLVRDKANQKMHVMSSGFGKGWKAPPGQAISAQYWEGIKDEMRGYLKYGAAKQIMQKLQGQELLRYEAAQSPLDAPPQHWNGFFGGQQPQPSYGAARRPFEVDAWRPNDAPPQYRDGVYSGTMTYRDGVFQDHWISFDVQHDGGQHRLDLLLTSEHSRPLRVRVGDRVVAENVGAGTTGSYGWHAVMWFEGEAQLDLGPPGIVRISFQSHEWWPHLKTFRLVPSDSLLQEPQRYEAAPSTGVASSADANPWAKPRWRPF